MVQDASFRARQGSRIVFPTFSLPRPIPKPFQGPSLKPPPGPFPGPCDEPLKSGRTQPVGWLGDGEGEGGVDKESEPEL
jgi:hypothetical protein